MCIFLEFVEVHINFFFLHQCKTTHQENNCSSNKPTYIKTGSGNTQTWTNARHADKQNTIVIVKLSSWSLTSPWNLLIPKFQGKPIWCWKFNGIFWYNVDKELNREIISQSSSLNGISCHHQLMPKGFWKEYPLFNKCFRSKCCWSVITKRTDK